MKMCGATNGFIRMPFVFEGIVLGLASAIIGFACQWGIYELLINAIPERQPDRWSASCLLFIWPPSWAPASRVWA